jgi:hypothetical protein
LGDFKSKIPSIGGKVGTVIAKPCVNSFKITDKSDFILLGCKVYIILIKLIYYF